MAFGLNQWLISFTVFLIVLTIITLSAVHLGRKDFNITSNVTDFNITSRFLDMDDYSIQWEKYVYEKIYISSTP